MAPNLAVPQHELTRLLTSREIAEVAGCSSRAIKSVRADLRKFGGTPNGGGRIRGPCENVRC